MPGEIKQASMANISALRHSASRSLARVKGATNISLKIIVFGPKQKEFVLPFVCYYYLFICSHTNYFTASPKLLPLCCSPPTMLLLRIWHHQYWRLSTFVFLIWHRHCFTFFLFGTDTAPVFLIWHRLFLFFLRKSKQSSSSKQPQNYLSLRPTLILFFCNDFYIHKNEVTRKTLIH